MTDRLWGPPPIPEMPDEPPSPGNYGPFRAHPVLDLIPMMQSAELAALAASISEVGLQEPIVLAGDRRTLVDGRQRYLACYEARVEPNYRVLPPSFTDAQIVDFIVAANLIRQHLSADQRVALGILLLEHGKQRGWPGD